ncbi:MAG: ribonuclease III [Ktedonobacterales bacterium]
MSNHVTADPSPPSTPQSDALAALQATIGHTFATRQHLLDALTHRSYAYEFAAPGVVSNERLEFLGDAVLGLIASDLLYTRFPTAPEGELTNLRAALVRASTLAAFARAIALGPYLRLGRGEEATGGRDRDLLLARAFEALIGALYQDGGIPAAQAFLEPLLSDQLTRLTAKNTSIKDDKSLLQELAQGQLGITPTYRVVSETGPSHDRTFVVEVHLGDFVAGRGEGRSKRLAEQAAAHDALRDDGWRTDDPPSPDH